MRPVGHTNASRRTYKCVVSYKKNMSHVAFANGLVRYESCYESWVYESWVYESWVSWRYQSYKSCCICEWVSCVRSARIDTPTHPHACAHASGPFAVSSHTKVMRMVRFTLAHHTLASHSRITLTHYTHTLHSRITLTHHTHSSHTRITFTHHIHSSHSRITLLYPSSHFTHPTLPSPSGLSSACTHTYLYIHTHTCR